MRKKELRKVRVAIAYLRNGISHLDFLLNESDRPFRVKRVVFSGGCALKIIKSARTLLQHTIEAKQ